MYSYNFVRRMHPVCMTISIVPSREECDSTHKVPAVCGDVSPKKEVRVLQL